jgi:hypothetical protein
MVRRFLHPVKLSIWQIQWFPSSHNPEFIDEHISPSVEVMYWLQSHTASPVAVTSFKLLALIIQKKSGIICLGEP